MSPATIVITTDPAPPMTGQRFRILVTVTGNGVVGARGRVTVTVAGVVRAPVWIGPDGSMALWAAARPAGTYPVTADYSGSTAILPGTGSASVDVAKNSQTVDFTALPGGLTYAGDPVTLSATASSGLTPVTFASSGACGAAGDQLSLDGVGDCTVTASQAGDSETEAASATRTVTVGRRPQALTLEPLADMVYGQVPVDVVAHSDVTETGLAVAVAATGACEMTADGKVTTSSVGDCVVTATQTGTTFTAPAGPVSRTVRVVKRAQTVTLSTLPAVIRGVAQIPVTGSSEFGLGVTITASGACTYAGGLVSVVNLGTCTVTATAAGDAVTEPATATTVSTVVAGTARVSAWISGHVGGATLSTPVTGSGSQLRPGSTLTVTAYSDPVVLATTTVGANGTAAVVGELPALGEGTHRVVVAGMALDGAAVQYTVRLGVGADGTITWLGTAPNLAATGADVQDAGMLAALWLVVGAGLLLMRRNLLRRRSSAVA